VLSPPARRRGERGKKKRKERKYSPLLRLHVIAFGRRKRKKRREKRKKEKSLLASLFHPGKEKKKNFAASPTILQRKEERKKRQEQKRPCYPAGFSQRERKGGQEKSFWYKVFRASVVGRGKKKKGRKEGSAAAVHIRPGRKGEKRSPSCRHDRDCKKKRKGGKGGEHGHALDIVPERHSEKEKKKGMKSSVPLYWQGEGKRGGEEGRETIMALSPRSF